MRLTEQELKELLAKGDVYVHSVNEDFTPAPVPPSDKLTEHQEQVRVFDWIRQNEAADPRLAYAFAVPNGGARHIAVAAKMKAEGVRRGVPDILMPVQSGGHVGLAIEMKVKGGRTSEQQEEWLARLRQQGWYAVVCWSAAEAVAAIQWYLGFTKPE